MAEEILNANKGLPFSETLKWLWGYWDKLRIRLYLLLFFTPLAIGFRIYTPVFLSELFDELVKAGKSGVISQELINQKIGLIFLFGVLHLFLYIFVQSLRAITNVELENDFRVRTYKYLVRLGQNFFQKFRTGDLITRLIDDVSEKKLGWFACSGIFRFYEAVIKIVGCFFLMIYINLSLTIVTAIPLIFMVTLYVITSAKTTAYSVKTQEAISRLNSFLTVTIDGIRIVKSYNQERNQEKFFSEVVDHQVKKEIDLVKISTILELSYSRVSELAMLLIFLFGGWLVIKGEITIGALVAFNSYIFMLIWPMVDIGQFFIRGRSAGVSVFRLKELENFQPEIINQEKPLPVPEKSVNVTFSGVSYTFPSGKKAFTDISFQAAAGDCIAIAGRVGSGKSTFLNLLPRIIDPDAGKLLLNEKSFRDYDFRQIRKMIGFVPQNPALFSDTIRNNIIFGRPEIDEERLKTVIRIAQLEAEIELFPDKLETVIGQKGITLSGGQKQRVAIARALLQMPRILILDDCTSALDSETESKLWNELYNFIPGITVFLVTHRVGTLQRADQIILLKDGEMVASGTHQELIKNSDYYRSIYSFSEE